MCNTTCNTSIQVYEFTRGSLRNRSVAYAANECGTVETACD